MTFDAALDRLLRALDSDHPGPLVVHVPAPVVPLRAFLRLDDESTAVALEPPQGPAVAAFGEIARIEPRTLDSLAGLGASARELLGTVEERRVADDDAPRSRLLGSLALRSTGVTQEPWDAFDSALLLPRWRYLRDGDRAWLSLTTLPSERRTDDSRRQLAEEITQRLRSLETPLSPQTLAPSAASIDEGDTDGWCALVHRATETIAARAFDKVVLARRARIELTDAIDPWLVLERLGADTTRFALRQNGSVFLGATPERLVRREGATVRVDALAGSASTDQGAQLSASRKDAEEHGLVVRGVVSVLEPLCSRLDVPERPGVRALRHLLHLYTPIEATLRDDVHVLDLADGLHPTPAIGGTPRDAALDWIAAHEHAARGLYAAPIGWCDAAGDGEFWVALRSGVLRGTRAWAWAGAGIVRDSNPAFELEETRLKWRGFLRALGVDR